MASSDTANSALPQTDESVTQQEELDTEVSQITTQQKSASQVESQGSFSRPMSRTSSITPVISCLCLYFTHTWWFWRFSTDETM